MNDYAHLRLHEATIRGARRSIRRTDLRAWHDHTAPRRLLASLIRGGSGTRSGLTKAQASTAGRTPRAASA